jgi:ATP-dependent protease Clp ATPase subunit
MLDVMYEVPSDDGLTELEITEDVVNGDAEPDFTSHQEYGVPS